MVDRRTGKKTSKPKLSVVPEVADCAGNKTTAKARRKPHRVTLDLSEARYKRLKFAAIAGRARGVKDGTQTLDSMNVIIERALDDYLEKRPSLFQPLGPDDL